MESSTWKQYARAHTQHCAEDKKSRARAHARLQTLNGTSDAKKANSHPKIRTPSHIHLIHVCVCTARQ